MQKHVVRNKKPLLGKVQHKRLRMAAMRMVALNL
jgi:hypothetical protein